MFGGGIVKRTKLRRSVVNEINTRKSPIIEAPNVGIGSEILDTRFVYGLPTCLVIRM